MTDPNSSASFEGCDDTEVLFSTTDIRDARALTFAVRTHGTSQDFRHEYRAMGLRALTFGPASDATDGHHAFEIRVGLEPGSDIEELSVAFNGILERVKYGRQAGETRLRETDFRRARGELLAPRQPLEIDVAGKEVCDDLTFLDAVGQ
jgi:hypothetical protein